MGFPLEVVGVGKKKIIGRIHIKICRIKNEIDGLDGKISKK
jgi:hypothetical protein